MADRVAAQVSLYPLRVPHLRPPIETFVRALQQEGLEATIGPLSTMVEGDAEVLFQAVAKAFAAAAQQQDVVLNLTMTNRKPDV